MCLKNPYLHYGLQDIDLITFAFINITLDAAKGVAWDKCQQMLQRSSWFMERGRMTKGDYPQWVPPKGIELITGSTTNHMIGRAIFACFIDEVSFQPNKDVEQQIAKAKKLVNTANTRMQSRFMKGEKNPTILLLASSKRTEQSYLETFIAEKKKNNSKTTLIVDEPQWVIRTDKDSKEKFKVAVGNKYLTSELLPLNISENEVQLYRERGFDILEVPMGYREAFEDDLDQSLMDTAGISVSVISKFISGPRLLAIKDANLKNPFRSNILVIGNNPEDKEQYYDHFDLSLVDVKQREKPLFVHMDMSISGDKTGICGIWITGKHPPEDNKTTADELYYQLAFIVSIKAPKGYQISFEKNRQFIYWLRDQGFNVKGVSTDSFQSVDTSQSLISHNFNYTQISVDRLTNKVCEPYQYLRTIIYEKRLKIPVDVDLLFEELIGLERDNNTGKIDHSAASINCLSGDTSISLVDGREISIENLVSEFQEGKENFVYTFNETSKKIEAKRIINAFCSGYTNQLIRVTLDNNQSFLCTPEHRIMLRNGVYCEAKDLCLDDSLMPLYRRLSQKGISGYRLYYEPFEDRWHFEHRKFAAEVLDEKYLVHHKDCNKLNNSPENLIWMSKQAHIDTHAQLQTGAQSIEARKKRSDSVKRYHAKGKNTLAYWTRYHKGLTPIEAYAYHVQRQEKQDKRKKLLFDTFGISDYDNLPPEDKIQLSRKLTLISRGCNPGAAEKVRKKHALIQTYYNVDYSELSEHDRRSLSIKYAHESDPTYQQRVSSAVSSNHALGKYVNAAAALKECNKHKKILKELFPQINEEKFVEFFGISYSDVPSNMKAVWTNRYREKMYSILNHKIINVESVTLSNSIPVYDLTIEDNHNFALSCGIFVHNSKDSADALAGSIYNASKHGDEFAFNFGETLDSIQEANLDLDNFTDDTVKFEEALKSKMTQRIRKEDKSPFMDFGMGPAQEYTSQSLAEGILIW